MNKNDFPIFHTHKNLIYLDSASTTQKPKSVIDAITNFYSQHNSNVNRGLYQLAENATDSYQAAREKVAEFINASPEEIIFVSSATAAFNGIANSIYVSGLVSENPRIITTDLEHHSNLIPWQCMPGAELIYLELSSDYQIQIPSKVAIEALRLEKDFDILTLSNISNVTGTYTNPVELRNALNPKLLIVDATQSIAHKKIDVAAMDVDFLAFSGHKLYGPMGIGVLYINKKHLDTLSPFNFGGGMVSNVSKSDIELKEAPEKFEAGTPNVAGAIGLAAGISYLETVGLDTIEKHENKLRKTALEALKSIDGISIYHMDSDSSGPVISFSHNKVHAHDIAQFLGDKGIAIRAGHHCTGPLHKSLDIAATARISFGIYNEESDIEACIDALKDAIAMYS